MWWRDGGGSGEMWKRDGAGCRGCFGRRNGGEEVGADGTCGEDVRSFDGGVGGRSCRYVDFVVGRGEMDVVRKWETQGVCRSVVVKRERGCGWSSE